MLKHLGLALSWVYTWAVVTGLSHPSSVPVSIGSWLRGPQLSQKPTAEKL